MKTEFIYDGFDVDVSYDGENALEKFATTNYDLVLLDIMLPIKDGYECIREMRKQSAVPIIILTAKKEVYDKVAFLNAGADDYVTKPFDTIELIARVKRNISRVEKTNKDSILKVDYDGYRAFILNNELNLTKTEFEILIYLHKCSNVVKTRDEIINSVFGQFYGESNIIDVNIKNIRSKINKYTDDEIISTVRCKGYVIRT